LPAKAGQADSLFEIFRSEDVPPEVGDQAFPAGNKSNSTSVPDEMF